MTSSPLSVGVPDTFRQTNLWQSITTPTNPVDEKQQSSASSSSNTTTTTPDPFELFNMLSKYVRKQDVILQLGTNGALSRALRMCGYDNVTQLGTGDPTEDASVEQGIERRVLDGAKVPLEDASVTAVVDTEMVAGVWAKDGGKGDGICGVGGGDRRAHGAGESGGLMNGVATVSDTGSLLSPKKRVTRKSSGVDCPAALEGFLASLMDDVKRVLKPCGRALVLVPGHNKALVRALLGAFKDQAYLLRVHHGELSEGGGGGTSARRMWSLFVATKLNVVLGGSQMFEFYSGHVVTRFSTVDALMDQMKIDSELAALNAYVKANWLEEEVSLNLVDKAGSLRFSTKYGVRLLDCPDNASAPVEKCYGVFIINVGREKEWLFSDPEGRQSLAKMTGFRRLAVVRIMPGNEIRSMDDVKTDLDPVILRFARVRGESGTIEVVPERVLYMTDGGEDLGRRSIVHEGTSALSGAYRVEDIIHDANGEGVRRLVFMDSQNVIQSEAQLIAGPVAKEEPTVPKKKKSHGRKKPKDLGTVEGQGPVYQIDHGVLCCRHHEIMIKPLVEVLSGSLFTCCLVGLGGGCLASHIMKKYPEVRLDSVELDPEMVQVARNQFDLVECSNHRVTVGDGIDYLKNIETGTIYDVILLDVAGPTHESGISGPPVSFLEPDFLSGLAKLTRPVGMVVVNLIIRDPALRQETMARFRPHFNVLAYQEIEDEVNCILFGFHVAPTWLGGDLKGLSTLSDAQCASIAAGVKKLEVSGKGLKQD